MLEAVDVYITEDLVCSPTKEKRLRTTGGSHLAHKINSNEYTASFRQIILSRNYPNTKSKSPNLGGTNGYFKNGYTSLKKTICKTCEAMEGTFLIIIHVSNQSRSLLVSFI